MQRRVLLLICWIKQLNELALVLYQQAALFCKQKSPLNPILLSLPPATLLALTMVEITVTRNIHTFPYILFQRYCFPCVLSFAIISIYLLALPHYICLCLAWERHSGFPGLQGKDRPSQLPSSCRDRNVYFGSVLVQTRGWTNAHSRILSHPTQNNEGQATAGSCPRDVPWQGCRLCSASWVGSKLEGHPSIGEMGHSCCQHAGDHHSFTC